MPTRNTCYRYGSIAMLFHWTIAILIFTNFPLGLYFHRFLKGGSPEWQFFAQLHVSIGLTVLFLSLMRLTWRLINQVPDIPYDIGNKMRIVTHIAHYSLYAFMIIVPLIGWGMLSVSPRPMVLFGTGPWPKLQLLVSLPTASKEVIGKTLAATHLVGASLLIVLALGHVAAAVFYHYFIRKDQVLQRMMPGTEIKAPAARVL